ncbi:hypothetical protein VT98_10394 [Candidatus Electrothrix communis]|uniref:Uncharacterized protein n=1 Tax=Candidatus Electrothrix communis TaxID=1859133 RepID=A0A3S3UDU9_9BACT|nr:hypothetical protein [Desulfobulbus sp. US4]MCW5214524.1 hypothetical protein [Desulfobulbus sp. US5]RWX49514.1 hypothetical protein VT98_10394 [Candidatus Electrothrix communis]WLE98798.1 MAG: hypothetical protein QTN59_08145 [Candidatus Electrothrix communis]
MRTNGKQLIIRTQFIALTACILLAANPTWAATFAEETQELITQQMTARINGNMQKMLADQTIFSKMQQSMMTMTSKTIKKSTAERKRATVVETCMECRTAKPLKVKITGRTTILDADTQAIINQKMAAMVTDTIRKNSSDPTVARSVQEKMMGERMPKSILRTKMQPYMMGAIFDSTGGSLAEKKGADSVAQIVRDTPLVTMQKN